MNYKKTIYACFVGYIIQAIINNFLPLLFLILQKQYEISLQRITMLITINFAVQLTVDFLAAIFADKVGYRKSIMLAHILSATGLLLLPVLPDLLPPFTGIVIAVVLYAVGGGLLEVLISPIMEACPTDNKETAMSLMHSFYCWGQVGVVLMSALFFQFAGIENWKLLSVLWAIVPILNGIFFSRVPIASLLSDDEKGMTIGELCRSRLFWILMLMMLCSGASELSVSQWASYFAEHGLHISKTYGDLAGPMAFAVCMGSARTVFGKFGDRIKLDYFMTGSAVLCVVSYLMISIIRVPVVNLFGCALCGLSVGIMWPGTFSKAAASIRRGGTVLFSLLALAGDIGCSGGPTVVGIISNIAGGNMQTGIQVATVFPICITVCLLLLRREQHSHE